jgi:tetratricopeptide (TPR) repeat protein
MRKSSKREKLEALKFKISFFEGIVKERPNYVDALIPLAEAYTKSGEYEKGLEIDERLAKLKPNDPVVHYNLACSYSLLKKKLLALNALKKAIKLGYRDWQYMERDRDLSFLRDTPEYKKLVAELKKAALEK